MLEGPLYYSHTVVFTIMIVVRIVHTMEQYGISAFSRAVAAIRGAEHQVIHHGNEPAENAHLGSYEAVLLVRSATFRHMRCSNPGKMWHDGRRKNSLSSWGRPHSPHGRTDGRP